MKRLTPIDLEALWHYLGADAGDRLARYFKSGLYTGGRFERFAEGGDRSDVAGQFTSDDIVAVSLLGVRMPGRASLDILEVHAVELNALLTEIPTGVDLWKAEEALVAPDSPADRLWGHLHEFPGIRWVTAGKLLARKRPRLIPVYDRVVKAALGRSDHDEWWRPIRIALTENPDIVARLESLRRGVGIEDVSLLRVLDVCVWMGAHGNPEPTPDAET